MFVPPSIEKENLDLKIRMFIDFDKEKEKYFNNIYIEDYRLVVKMPFILKNDKECIDIEKFDLSNYIYICDYP